MGYVQVEIMVLLANRIKRCGEYQANGDCYPGGTDATDQPGENKERNAERWGKELESLVAMLRVYVHCFGFDGVAFYGLCPTLRHNGRDVDIPW
jgi:hypothetical protein